MAAMGGGSATTAIDTAASATLTIISRRRPRKPTSRPRKKRDVIEATARRVSRSPDRAGGEATVGAQRGQIDERDVDGGQHDAAHQQGAEQAGHPNQRPHPPLAAPAAARSTLGMRSTAVQRTRSTPRTVAARKIGCVSGVRRARRAG